MTDTPPGTESSDADWNRQASTFDWEGWIAEENAADAERAKAKAAEEAAAQPQPFPTAQLNYPAPTGQPVGASGPNYPPPVGLTQSFTPAPAVSSSYGWSSPDGHPMPTGYAQPGFSGPQGYRGVPTSRPTDVVSILALIFGILPVVPAGFILGIIGIVRTANPIRKGRWMAVTGLILSILWAASFVALPLFVHGHDAPRDSAGHVTATSTVSIFKLRKGDCFTQHFQGTTFGVSEVTVVPCSQLHNSTVFATVKMSGRWTNGDDMVARGAQACVPALKAFYHGIPDPSPLVKFGPIVPGKVEWAAGSRTARCVAADPTKQFTGDIRNE